VFAQAEEFAFSALRVDVRILHALVAQHSTCANDSFIAFHNRATDPYRIHVEHLGLASARSLPEPFLHAVGFTVLPRLA
jgi:hypothetical protein